MISSLRTPLLLLMSGMLFVHAQHAALAQSEPAARSAAATKPQVSTSELGETVATVNGAPITKRELVKLLSQFQIPPGNEQAAYDSGMELLVNTRLLEQFLAASKVQASRTDVEKAISTERARLEQQGSSLEKVLAETNTTLDELRAQIGQSIQWRAYVTEKASDAELQDYLKKNADVFSGTLVKASHILVKAKAGDSAEVKQKAQQKLAQIKQEIESKKITFADAANKYSEDDGNVAQPSGGDLGFFPRKGQYIEPFARAAFALKKGEISDPVETEYGEHLIYVTDRKEGETLDFEKIKNEVLNQYAADLQNDIVEAERKTAKIEIKPMPADLFRLIRPADAPAAAAPADARKASAPAGR